MTAVLACYLDDSDASTGSVTTIAGYVADEAGWKRFEPVADAICDEFGVDLIRGRELDARKGCFKGWSVPKTAAFLNEIAVALHDYALFGISRSIIKNHYKKRKTQTRLNPNLSAYGFAFGSIVFSLCQEKGIGLTEEVARDGVAYFVESGNQNNPDLERYIHSEVTHGTLHANTLISFIAKRSCRAIQVADLYAFYSRRRANRFHKTQGKMVFFPDVYAMHVQPKLPHYTGLIEEPYTSATNLRTGETFQLVGLVNPLDGS